MQCEHWDQGARRSCRYLDVPYGEQVAAKSETAAEALALVPTAAGVHWLSPRRSAPTAFRTDAKLVVGGTRRRPTLGILGPGRCGVDLSGCPIQHPAISRATPALKRFIRSLDLIPYDIPTKNGEFEYVLLTVRADEIILSKRRMLPIRTGDFDLALGPGSFIQTNAAVAGDLYRQAADWAALPLASGDAPQTLWDLYCGIGEFAPYAVNTDIPRVIGVEVSERAIISATHSALQAGLSRTAARFITADATAWAVRQGPATAPDVLIVNLPRRGIRDALAQWINEHAGECVIYSSCNPTGLAWDLKAMSVYRCVKACLFDMFPHTDHVEVAVLLRRTPSRAVRPLRVGPDRSFMSRAL